MVQTRKEKNTVCTKCSRELSSEAKFCNFCGAPRPQAKTAELPEQKNSAARLTAAAPAVNQPSVLDIFNTAAETLKNKNTVSSLDLENLAALSAQIADKKQEPFIRILLALIKNKNKYLTGFILEELHKIITAADYEKFLEKYIREDPALNISTLLAAEVKLPEKIIVQMRQQLQELNNPEKEWCLQKLEKIPAKA